MLILLELIKKLQCGRVMERSRVYINIAIVVVSFTILILYGCGNDNPRPVQTFKVNIEDLRHQLGKPSLASAGVAEVDASRTLSAENAAIDSIATIIVGPLTYRYHKPCSTCSPVPYDPNGAFTDTDQDQLEDDAVNSADMLKFVPFQSNVQEIELDVPNEGLGSWQIMAAATRKAVSSTGDLALEENKDVIVYIGFTSQAFSSAEELNNSNINLRLVRGCLLSRTPSGCASYDDDGEAVVTEAVEIVGLEITYIGGSVRNLGMTAANNVIWVNGTRRDFPWIVRNPTTSFPGSITPDQAVTYLQNIQPEYETGDNWKIIDTFQSANSTETYYQTIRSIKARTTHSRNPAEVSTCRGLDASSDITDWTSYCQVQKYPKYYFY